MGQAERWESVASMSSFLMEHFFFGAKSPIELNIATNSVPHPNSENAGPALEVLAAGQTHTSFEHFKVQFVRVSRGTEYCCVISAFMFKLLLPY